MDDSRYGRVTDHIQVLNWSTNVSLGDAVKNYFCAAPGSARFHVHPVACQTNATLTSQLSFPSNTFPIADSNLKILRDFLMDLMGIWEFMAHRKWSL